MGYNASEIAQISFFCLNVPSDTKISRMKKERSNECFCKTHEFHAQALQSAHYFGGAFVTCSLCHLLFVKEFPRFDRLISASFG